MPLYVFVFAACVEVLQYFDLVTLLGLSGNRFARIVPVMRPGVCFWRSGSGESEDKYAERRDRSGKNREVAGRTGSGEKNRYKRGNKK